MRDISLGFGMIIEICLIIWTLFILFILNRKFSSKYGKFQLNEQYYKSLYEQNPDAIITFDTEGKFISANSSVSQYGFTVEELIHKPFNQFLHHKEQERVMGYFIQAIKGTAVEYECSMIDKIGNLRQIYVTNIPIFVSGKITGVYAIIKDITSFTKAQMDLIEAEDKYRSLIENSLVGVYILVDGELVYVNPRLCEMSGYRCEELLGMKITDFIYPEDLSLVQNNILKRFNDEPDPNRYEYRAIHKDKRVITIELYGSRIVYKGRDAIIGTVIDITERKNTEKMIKHMAYHDQLTDLPNRNMLREKLDEAVAYSSENKTNFALLFVDLDRFKVINDTLGHEFGDRVLIDIAKRLKSCIGANDMIARYGGDEFSILLLESNEIRARQVAKKIITTLALPLVYLHHRFYVTPSIGISIFPEHGDNFNTLIKHSDLAMYEAKNTGKNNFQIFSEELNQKAMHVVEMENDMRQAIERNEFVLYYQPQINLETNQIMGAEALIRWVHPEKGIISPTEFIPIAEETGLIISIGEWAMRTACLQNKKWQDAGMEPITISVNISAKQFFQGNLADLIKNILEETALEAEYLELEITESMTMDVEKSISTLGEFKKIGVKISIDDFGTGYSSLNYLKKLPIDKLKIDQSFIRDCHYDQHDKTIVQIIILLAQLLKIKVIAEGVEKEEQKDFLLMHGCREAQGYYFSKPLSVGDFEKIFLRQKYSKDV